MAGPRSVGSRAEGSFGQVDRSTECRRLVEGLLPLRAGIRVQDDTRPRLQMDRPGSVALPGGDHHRPQRDRDVQVTDQVDRTDPARIGSAAHRLELVDDLHRPDLRSSAHRAHRQGRSQGIQIIEVRAERPTHHGADVHHVAVPLDLHHLLEGDRSRFADPTKVVAAEIDEHDVFGPLLFIGEKLLFQRTILGFIPPAGSGAGKRSIHNLPVPHPTEDLRTRGHEHAASRLEIDLIRRWIDHPEGSIEIEWVDLGRPFESLAQDHLEGVPRRDVCPSPLHGGFEVLSIHARSAGSLRRKIQIQIDGSGGQMHRIVGHRSNQFLGLEGRSVHRGIGVRMIPNQLGGDHEDGLGHVIEDQHATIETEMKIRQSPIVHRCIGERKLLGLRPPGGVVAGKAHETRVEGTGRRHLTVRGEGGGLVSKLADQLEWISTIVTPFHDPVGPTMLEHEQLSSPGKDLESRANPHDRMPPHPPILFDRFEEEAGLGAIVGSDQSPVRQNRRQLIREDPPDHLDGTGWAGIRVLIVVGQGESPDGKRLPRCRSLARPEHRPGFPTGYTRGVSSTPVTDSMTADPGVRGLAEATVHLEGITKNYLKPDGSVLVEALRGIDLRIPTGQYLAIMGSSGSGKSTLMNILGCLDRPTSGSYRLEGLDVATLDDTALSRARGRRIGFVFQAFNLISELTIVENVEVPLFYQGLPRSKRHELAIAKLELVGLADRLNHRPSELSGGQQQRVAIARSLVTNPAILMADEPTGNLDSQTGRSILDLFDRFHDEGLTVIMVTHDDLVAQRCQRVIRLADGLIESDLTNMTGS